MAQKKQILTLMIHRFSLGVFTCGIFVGSVTLWMNYCDIKNNGKNTIAKIVKIENHGRSGYSLFTLRYLVHDDTLQQKIFLDNRYKKQETIRIMYSKERPDVISKSSDALLFKAVTATIGAIWISVSLYMSIFRPDTFLDWVTRQN